MFATTIRCSVIRIPLTRRSALTLLIDKSVVVAGLVTVEITVFKKAAENIAISETS